MFFFPTKIHAYNLETNAWEEIATKPHEKIGKLKVLIYLSLVNAFNTFVLGGVKVISLNYMANKVSVELVLEITCILYFNYYSSATEQKRILIGVVEFCGRSGETWVEWEIRA